MLTEVLHTHLSFSKKSARHSAPLRPSISHSSPHLPPVCFAEGAASPCSERGWCPRSLPIRTAGEWPRCLIRAACRSLQPRRGKKKRCVNERRGNAVLVCVCAGSRARGEEEEEEEGEWEEKGKVEGSENRVMRWRACPRTFVTSEEPEYCNTKNPTGKRFLSPLNSKETEK